MKLYTYFRSSAAFRVRIALNLKGLDATMLPVHLTRDGGEQFDTDYTALNPDAAVPTLIDGAHTLTQSLAICEYLDETHPQPPLLPAGPADRAYVRALALTIACEIHPLNNLRVLRYLKRDLHVSDDAKTAWYRHWVERGLSVIDTMLDDPRRGRFCFGDTPTLADCFLVPQIFNAQRFDCRLDDLPLVMGVFDACMSVDAFERARPDAQPDAE